MIESKIGGFSAGEICVKACAEKNKKKFEICDFSAQLCADLIDELAQVYIQQALTADFFTILYRDKT